MTQKQINAAHKRSLKITYQGLTSTEKLLVKLQEKYDELDMSIRITYRSGQQRFGNNFRENPGFQESFELIYEWESQKEKILTRIFRVESSRNLNIQDIMVKFRLINQRKGYGGSF